jgi:hypothetical protein
MMIEANGTAMITLKCGPSSIQLTPASIVIKSPLVLIN